MGKTPQGAAVAVDAFGVLAFGYAVADGGVEHVFARSEAEHHAHFLVPDAPTHKVTAGVVEAAGELEALGVGEVEGGVKGLAVGFGVKSGELKNLLAVERAAFHLNGKIIAEVVIVGQQPIQLEAHVAVAEHRRANITITCEAGFGFGVDAERVVGEAEWDDHVFDEGGVNGFEAHAHGGCEFAAGQVEHVAACDQLAPGRDFDNDAFAESLVFKEGLGGLGIQDRRAGEHGVEVGKSARVAVPKAVGSGELGVGDDVPVGVVKAAVVGHADALDIQRLLVVKGPRNTGEALFKGGERDGSEVVDKGGALWA